MEKTAENKAYAQDTRKFKDAVLQDKIHKVFAESPITERMVLKDLCYRGQGFIGQHGKETKTSWDTLSYTLLQAHNVYQHIAAVQEANRRYEQGIIPKMLMKETFERIMFKDIVEEVFAQKDRTKSLEVIEKHNRFWMQMKSGSQGFSGKKAVNALTQFGQLFTEDSELEYEETIEDSDDAISEVLE